VDVPICIDSSVVPALRAGLEVVQGKPIVNSVTGEDEKLDAILPMVAERGAAVIAICNDESGISYDPGQRFLVAKKIVERAEAYGIPPQDVLIDPLALPAGAVQGSGKQVLEILRLVQDELGCNTVCGASNISFGLPGRPVVNAAFLAMAIGGGLTCAMDTHIKQAILAADMLLGRDENCTNWIMEMRRTESAGADAGGERKARRRARRERRTRG